jgi:hypothetical protein
MKSLSRTQAIHDIRSSLMNLVDDEHSMCEVAARLHIFCGGFAQWTFRELKQRYPTIVRSRPRITRKQLEELANPLAGRAPDRARDRDRVRHADARARGPAGLLRLERVQQRAARALLRADPGRGSERWRAIAAEPVSAQI